MTEQRRFAFEGDSIETVSDPLVERDSAARLWATDPSRNVALEASAGTGKTRVLVERYVRLVVDAQVAPRNILAITFTRKAAAEMRARVLDTLRARHREGAIAGERWREVRDAFPEIAISTIDAFCLSLLREFPLEAGIDPGFELVDETETPRLVSQALDRAMRIGRSLAVDDPDVALLYASLGERSLRLGLAALLDRRLVAWDALNQFLQGPTVHVSDACAQLHDTLRGALRGLPGGVRAFLEGGPQTPDFTLLAHDVRPLDSPGPHPPERLRGALDRMADHALTSAGDPRQRLSQKKADFRSVADYEAHKAYLLALGPQVFEARARFRHDLNLVLARGVRRVFAVARDQYRRTLEQHGVLDFSDVLDRALALLEQRDEFSRSRFKLEARYRHVLVDEFQDTSRAQWRLVRELMSAWAAGAGVADTGLAPSIFIVGDRKQSIYGFRDAEVSVLDAASRYIDALRPDLPARTSITRSFRSVRSLLHFVNDVFDGVDKQPARSDAFRYTDDDRFPLTGDAETDDSLGIVVGASDQEQADIAAEEIARLLLDGAIVRDRLTGLRREVGPGDIAVLFRAREGHRLFEEALGRRNVPYYVYKGLGFFDADEIKDLLALMGYLALPGSHLRSAALLRSRFVRVSDEGLKRLAPDLAGVLRPTSSENALPDGLADPDRQRLLLARASVAEWLPLVDQVPPAELIDHILADSAYAVELGGPTWPQARENIKKMRGLVRRMQNRGYATLGRMVDHFSELVAGGDESNAIIDAADAVNLMTVHAAKGLEFPVVFVVNIGKGSGGGRDAIRVMPAPFETDADEGPMVGIGEHRTTADRDADARETEETKRLLYVALTRARDRLYLGATRTEDGRFAPVRGSLGRILPASLQAVLAAPSAADSRRILWTGPSASHTLSVVAAPGPDVRVLPIGSGNPQPTDDLAPLTPDGPPRRSVTATLTGPDTGAAHGPATSSSVLGTLVHQLLATAHTGSGEANLDRLREHAGHALAAWPGALEVDDLATRAANLAFGVLNSPDVQALLSSGRAVFEVPYSVLAPDGAVVRGAIDCLVWSPGEATVLEFKTGQPSPAHQAQLDAYVQAAARLYPDRTVKGRLLYLGKPLGTDSALPGTGYPVQFGGSKEPA